MAQTTYSKKTYARSLHIETENEASEIQKSVIRLTARDTSLRTQTIHYPPSGGSLANKVMNKMHHLVHHLVELDGG